MTLPELHSLFLQYPAVSTDSRNIPSSSLFFALSGDHFNGNLFAEEALQKGAAFAVVSHTEHPLDSRYIVVEEVLKTLQDLASYHRDYCKTPVFGLTGSNGKTTTKELIYSVLSKKYNTLATAGNFNNHIGVPLTLLQLSPQTEMAVVEMGANHPGEIAFLCSLAKPDFGYITNFGKAHLEGFGSYEGVVKAKSELYDYLEAANKTIFYNAQDSQQGSLMEHRNNTIALNPSNSIDEVRLEKMAPMLSLGYHSQSIQTHLVGAYNFTNCAAAIGIGTYFKVPEKDIIAALEQYIPTNNRSQIKKTDSNTLILDAYNANPTSMHAAISSFKKMEVTEKVLILGDMLELGEYAPKAHLEIVELIDQTSWSAVFLVGKIFHQCNSSYPSFETTQDLIEHLKLHPLTQRTILLKGSRGIALEKSIAFL